MRHYPPGGIPGDADIKCTVSLAREDVYPKIRFDLHDFDMQKPEEFSTGSIS